VPPFSTAGQDDGCTRVLGPEPAIRSLPPAPRREAVYPGAEAVAVGAARDGHGDAGSERLVHKLDTFTDQNRAARATVRAAIWQLYRDLKSYRCAPTVQRKAALVAELDRVFTGKTGFDTLDRLLARLHANKARAVDGCPPQGVVAHNRWEGA
jgi:hypothetical protein